MLNLRLRVRRMSWIEEEKIANVTKQKKIIQNKSLNGDCWIGDVCRVANLA